MNEEKKSGSSEGNWTRVSSYFSKAIGIWPKRYNHLATQPLVHKCSKLENCSIFNYRHSSYNAVLLYRGILSNAVFSKPKTALKFYLTRFFLKKIGQKIFFGRKIFFSTFFFLQMYNFMTSYTFNLICMYTCKN